MLTANTNFENSGGQTKQVYGPIPHQFTTFQMNRHYKSKNKIINSVASLTENTQRP